MKSLWLAVGVVAVVFLRMAEAQPDEPITAATPAADLLRGKAPGEVRDDNGLKLKLVWCPPGTFMMEQAERVQEPAANKDAPTEGDLSPKDKPAPKARTTMKITPLEVILSEGYWLGKYEVTQSEWKTLMKTEPWKGEKLTKEGADYPATCVNWDHATDFCRKLTDQERQAGRLPKGWEYTLPTDAQWERACRAGTETKFSFGDDESELDDYAWHYGNVQEAGKGCAQKVGRKKANPWGLFDMHGNVWEWCRDAYLEMPPGGRDPEVKSDEKEGGSKRVSRLERVQRGGCWFWGELTCRSAFRSRDYPSLWNSGTGFRVARSPVR